MGCKCGQDINFLVYAVVILFGIGSWVAVNGLWVELPILVLKLPEGWNLPSYMTVIIQIANIGPLVYALANFCAPNKVNEKPVVYAVVIIGATSCLLLAFFWDATSYISGVRHSTALLVLQFFLALVDCTSSVLFLPFMAVFKPQYMTAYFIGEGFSGLLPSLVAIGQGVGKIECVNKSVIVNSTTNQTEYNVESRYLPPRFPIEDFFFFLFAMMIVCGLAFTALNYIPYFKKEHAPQKSYMDNDNSISRVSEPSGTFEMSNNSTDKFINPSDVPDERTYIRKGLKHHDLRIQTDDPSINLKGLPKMSVQKYLYFLGLIAIINAVSNSVLPSIQSYSCMPYGSETYHWAVTLANIANPAACFIAFFIPVTSASVISITTVCGGVFAAYILALAAYSPQPPLVGTDAGTVLVVAAWVLVTLFLTFSKVTIAALFRLEGRKALLWCGAVTQIGSFCGAVTIFVIVNICKLFVQAYPCS